MGFRAAKNGMSVSSNPRSIVCGPWRWREGVQEDGDISGGIGPWRESYLGTVRGWKEMKVGLSLFGHHECDFVASLCKLMEELDWKKEEF